MDIKKLDMKTSFAAGTALAVMSGFVPPISTTAVAGTAVVPVQVDIVTAITLANTTALNFGRIAITNGGPISGTHTLSPAGVVSNAVNTSVVVPGTPGYFEISGGRNAVNVTAQLSGAVTYNGGQISIDRLTFGGTGLVASVAIDAGTTGTLVFSGGAADEVDVGGRMVFSGTPAVGSWNGSSITVTITDIP
ncbi:MAG: DUF4402 domain-containing protein, partial [Pseudomonadota bacterium]|nr:DUF4402 domain-containing protein [Pseudomonadota bacterium]